MDILHKINLIVENKGIPDFRLDSYNGINLLITGSHDFCYYHELEIEFQEVSYLAVPSEFDYPRFRSTTSEETELIKQLVAINPEDLIFCIEAETSSSIEPLPFYIVAEAVNVRERTVFYYQRENLQDNEKIADWVKMIE